MMRFKQNAELVTSPALLW